MAVLIVSLVSAVGNFGWGLALAFSLSLASVLSLLILYGSPKRRFHVTTNPRRLRAFKAERMRCSLLTGGEGAEAGIDVQLVGAPEGLQVRHVSGEGGRHELAIYSTLAGSFGGLKVGVSMNDRLGLYARYEEHYLDLVVESLPMALRSRTLPWATIAQTLGELPSGTRGFAQEFYTAELYDTSRDAKDILWSRVAEVGNDEFMVKVREANIVDVLTVCLVAGGSREGKQLDIWRDLALEAIAQIGVAVLRCGASFKVVQSRGDAAWVTQAHDLRSLADLSMQVSRYEGVEIPVLEGLRASSLLITGEPELRLPEVFRLALRVPTVVISFQRKGFAPGFEVSFFTGSEDLTGLVNRVLGR